MHKRRRKTSFVATCFSSNNTCESWLIDSGCINHMTYDKGLFKQLESTEVKLGKIGNGEHIPIKGKGTIAIINYSSTKILIDVLYVLGIDQNLLSVTQLVEKGVKVIFENNSCIIKDLTSQEMFKVKMKSKSFSFDPMKEEQAAFLVTANSVDLWHKRLGHFHHLGMSYLLKNQLVHGVPFRSEKLAKCEACQFGKQTRKSFPERVQCQLAPYTPQQNGVSERKNRSIMEMARYMLHQKELPNKLCAEASNPAVFIPNRLPNEFCKIKLLSRLSLPQTGKFFISRDVHFMEDENWCWSDSKKNQNTELELEDMLSIAVAIAMVKRNRGHGTRHGAEDDLERNVFHGCNSET
ncbi:hypothetical protein CR513_02354, partial [Mucuna pruriens]